MWYFWSFHVYFDNFKIEKVKGVPIKESVITFSNHDNQQQEEREEDVTSKVIFFFVVCGIFGLSMFILKKKQSSVSEPHSFDKIDFIIMILLTLFTCALSFYQLGDRKVPSSFWKAGSAGEYIVMALEEPTKITKMAHYGNIPEEGYYNVSYSMDGTTFQNAFTLGENVSSNLANQKKKSSFFAWEFASNLSFTCKYIKIESVKPGWGINEIAFYQENDKKVSFQIKEVYTKEGSIGTPECLVDEQDLVPNESNYQNGTYFDEVYFPRTAYEQLNGLSIYETTHPPFGKILISIRHFTFWYESFWLEIYGHFIWCFASATYVCISIKAI